MEAAIGTRGIWVGFGLLQSRQCLVRGAKCGWNCLEMEGRVMVKAKIVAGLVLMSVASVGVAQTRVRHREVVKAAEPEGPVVVMDTSMGRITCRLYAKQAPVTVANFVGLAEGSKDWIDPATGKVVHGKGFYDETGLVGITDGVMGGDRMGMLKGTAGAPFAAEKSGLGFDRAGRLVMAKYHPPMDAGAPAVTAKGPEMTSSSVFFVLEHADREYDGRGTVFGQCDEASLPVVAAISHALLMVDNHPAAPVAINHIAVVKQGRRCLRWRPRCRWRR